MALLTVENVNRRFGGILALDDVSLELDEGTIAGLIGPNGAGKTTLFNVITRLYTPDGGARRLRRPGPAEDAGAPDRRRRASRARSRTSRSST